MGRFFGVQKNKPSKKKNKRFLEAEKGMYLNSPIRCRLDSLNSLGGFALSSALNREAICRFLEGGDVSTLVSGTNNTMSWSVFVSVGDVVCLFVWLAGWMCLLC